MIRFFILFLLMSSSAFSSVVGVTTHPLSREARVITGELAGYFNKRNEMGGGLRYTQSVFEKHLLDVAISGGQYSRGFTVNAGMDFELLSEEENQPRVSVKPFYMNQHFDRESSSVMGAAPTLRKTARIEEFEFYPFLALPNGMIIGESDDFNFYSSVSVGASMPFPWAQNDKLALTLEGNKNLGHAYDYVSAAVSWIWK
jgi:hypothetical protein